ncbi:putative RNA-binding, CRM domain, YhbY-like superfamily [Helianthus annuus]|nr:putative RNA-binding, CRM domain, YhbY-like superfamily [Helianthus annuus]KAJ0510395.1 putative RNA-binding, CRM domain, YhbY-like superfamily [Helianthus annuus]KAJ0518282.1 putative RNA-binding, CRM domain, YhbY-like superfamily [Helianthus annuus]KAJ0686316.1 putative RNA-binding, CRM domain, YhbY-like superfamily [Helianthus annuus]KAJ0690144.1 putative RNA-binding, CRM domain, YhbY-like superfamily [Helianthus annuus]
MTTNYHHFPTMKLTEIPFRNTKFTFPFPFHSNTHLLFFSSSSSSILKPSFIKPFSSIHSTTDNNSTTTTTNNPSSSSSSSAPWLNNWSTPPPQNPNIKPELGKRSKLSTSFEPPAASDGAGPTRTTAIDRIVLRLRNLGLGSDDEEEEEEIENARSEMVLTGEEKLGDLLRRDWVRPDRMLIEDDDEETVLPWERDQGGNEDEQRESEGVKKRMKAPTLAELTLEDSELRRLRTLGTTLRERITIPKAGITASVLEKIHDQWRKSELVRLKFHEVLARDMKTAHEIVQRRTGGLVIWQSGSVMMVYRGVNYAGPSSRPQSTGDTLFVPDVSSTNNINNDNSNKPITRNGDARATPVTKSMTEEECEFNSVLDGLGPRFHEWWGTGILPVDADLLPQTIPGFKTPFRLLPTGMRPRLTNAEMTNLRKLAKSLPCHFALGRNRNHQGLAAAIIKLWEKSMVAKIAVKRGIQNTNNELMAEELKKLTGGVLLLRNKYYIVIYRGKDFVPTTVATALAERQEMTKDIQDAEEKVRIGTVEPVAAVASVDHGQVALAGSLAEFYEAQAQWGREKTTEEHEQMLVEASKTKITRVVKKLEHKLFIAQSKRSRADKELAKIRETWLPADPPDDQETITDEERVMFRRVGLRMKPYVPLGIRGVFDGVIENMHLHWKHRELVKLISKQKDVEFVEETARFMEYESGGILIDIVRVPKGYAIIYYRGKNYRRPISIRPRSLPSKARALKRWKALQRYEALTEHVTELENTIKQMKAQNDIKDTSTRNTDEIELRDHVLESSEGEDESSWSNSDDDDDYYDEDEGEGEDLKDEDEDEGFLTVDI